MFCFHEFSEVKADGFQYCKKCGKAIMPSHAHRWVDVSTTNIHMWDDKMPSGAIILQRCSVCGALNNHHVGQTKGWW